MSFAITAEPGRASGRAAAFLFGRQPDFRLLLVFLAVFVCAGCQSSVHELSGERGAMAPVSLSAGDMIKISFPGTPELNQAQKIRTDGKVSLPLIGEVTAAGKTLTSFQEELIHLYKPQLKNSDVLVTLENGTGRVVVSGAVAKPTSVQFDRPTTVFQAIMEAGGVTAYGSLKKVRLVRTVNGEQQSEVLDLTPTIKNKNSHGIYVRDGDVIFVPETAF